MPNSLLMVGFAIVVHDPFLPDDTGDGVGTAAFYSNEALQAAQLNAATEVRRVLSEEPPSSPVGTHRFPARRAKTSK